MFGVFRYYEYKTEVLRSGKFGDLKYLGIVLRASGVYNAASLHSAVL